MTTPDNTPATPLQRSAGLLLVGAIFVLAICALVYELIAGALSSYLLGDSVTQFSLVIGLFLTAMGAGSFLSRFIRTALLARLIEIEALIGLIGGLTALIGFATFAYTELYSLVLLGLVMLVGTLIGLEIPLVIRILRDLQTLRVTLANVLSADYLGALAASLLFPFLLLPELGLARAGLVVGLVNVAVAGLLAGWFRRLVRPQAVRLWSVILTCGLVLAAALAWCGQLVRLFEDRIYQDEIIFAQDTPYQRLVLTRWKADTRLYLDGHLQFSSVDEYRYHEALVHPALATAAQRTRVAILGGGDGLAAREVLKYSDVERIDLVELDPAVSALFAEQPLLRALNGDALRDPRIRIVNQDALKFLESAGTLYDVIIIDLPDPNRPALGKLYSRAFYGLAFRRLAHGGVLVTQATSPYRSRAAFWCIVHTLRATPVDGPDFSARPMVHPYHTYVPTFGTWGFVLAGRELSAPPRQVPDVPLRYLTDETLAGLFTFPRDIAEVPTGISTLDDPLVAKLYVRGYHRYLD